MRTLYEHKTPSPISYEQHKIDEPVIPYVTLFPDGNIVVEPSSIYEALKMQIDHPDMKFQGEQMDICNMSVYEGSAQNFMMVMGRNAREFEEMYFSVVKRYGCPQTAMYDKDPCGRGEAKEPWWEHCGFNQNGTPWIGEEDNEGNILLIEPCYAANEFNDPRARILLEKAITKTGGQDRISNPVHGDSIWMAKNRTRM